MNSGCRCQGRTAWCFNFLERFFMSNLTYSEVPETGKMNSFIGKIFENDGSAERRYWRDESDVVRFLEGEVKARDGAEIAFELEQKFSTKYIVQQSLCLHFMLMLSALESLNSMFTDSEMGIILNTNCGPFWQWYVGRTVATMVMEDHGIAELSDLDDDSELKILVEKLIPLSDLQNAALVDVCERFWRTPNVGSLKEKFRKMNLVLA